MNDRAADDNHAASEEPARRVSLDLDLCKACGICVALCPRHVFDSDSSGYPSIARPADCNSCLICELHCPELAIEVRRRARKRAAAEPKTAAEARSAAELEGVAAAVAVCAPDATEAPGAAEALVAAADPCGCQDEED